MWYYINNNNQEGPADEATMAQLIANRTLSAQTMVWAEGMADWQPVAQTPLAPYVPGPAAPKPVTALGHPGLGMAMTQAAAIKPQLGASMGWKQILFGFEGRIPRSKFWMGHLIWLGVFFVVGVVAGLLGGTSESGEGPPAILLVLVLAAYLPYLWSTLALQVKRWHDRGKSGWYVLVVLIPFVGGIWALVECGFLRGTVGPNQFGQDPG